MPDKDCELIVENFPIGFIYLNGELDDNGKLNDFIVNHVNIEFENLFKLNRSDILNKHIQEISNISTFFQKEFFPTLVMLSQGNEKQSYNKFDKKLNKWFKISFYSPRNNDLAIFFSDITKCIQPFTDTNMLFNIATDLITISDLNGLYLQVNLIWSTSYGYSVEEVEKHYAWEFVPAEEYTTIKNLCATLENSRYKCKSYTSIKTQEW
jgi:hypothetical protein